MRDLSSGLEQHLQSGVTTLCTAWKLTLSGGREFGFSNHDRALLIDGLTYEAGAGLNETDAEARLGFASDNGTIQGVLDVAQISEVDIANGVLNDAQLTRYRVNWADPTQYVPLSTGVLGQVTLRGEVYEVEWLGLASKLDRSTGRVFSKKCDAQFGDARCGLNTASFPQGTLCSKTLSVCRDQFNNALNFRGFPYLLGDDQLYAAPQIGTRRDGGSRYR